MPANEVVSSRRKVIYAASLVALPVVLFFAILFHYAVNIPIMDDYDGGLDYLNQLSQLHGFWAKIVMCMTAQHNEYKTLFANTVVWIQLAVFGHIDFRLTCFAGNLFVLLMGVVLWKMFLPKQKDLAVRLALFAPAALTLFQLNYVQTLDWSLPALQNLAVPTFTLFAIYFLMRDTTGFYYAAMGMMVLSISASTNGFFVVPIGGLILLMRRRYAQVAGWAVVAGACLALYLFRYTFLPSLAPEHHSFVETFLFNRPIYLLSFLGNAAYLPKQASLFLGIAIAIYFGYLVRRGYWRRNPMICYCVLFVLLTALAVTGLRSQLGLWEGTVSRYRIYCDLLLIFGWFSFVEEFLQYEPERLGKNRQFRMALAAALIFCLVMDGGGIYSLRKRNRMIERGMALYLSRQAVSPVSPMPHQGDDYDRFDFHARDVMDRSIRLGIYRPPGY